VLSTAAINSAITVSTATNQQHSVSSNSLLQQQRQILQDTTVKTATAKLKNTFFILI
jgi:hypothetical protein